MDANSRNISGELSRASSDLDNPSLHVFLGTCTLCHKTLSSDDEFDDHETISLCGDCKFLLLEDLEVTSPDVYRRRRPISRRRYNSSESTESVFSQQFSRMISQARLNPSITLDNDFQSLDGDIVARSMQRASSRTTPNGSRSWRRVFSDTESDGVDSLNGESESNASFRRYRNFNGGETDAFSYVDDDEHSLLEMENFGGSDVDTDTDIDPMNAGIYQWNSDDQEVDDDDSEWEIADNAASTIDSYRAGIDNSGFLRSNGSYTYTTRLTDFLSPEVERQSLIITREHIQTHSDHLMNTDLEESDVFSRVGESGDYLDSRGFQNLLDRLAETESLTRGAPPASASFVNNLPRVTITKIHDKTDNLACAICKDSLTAGTLTNQLPCFHMYHPSCILPWLNARNTCPLCRYELPTDDKDYEERKRRDANRYGTFHASQRMNNDGSSVDARQVVANEHHQVSEDEDDDDDEDSIQENNVGSWVSPRSRWFFLAPIASIFGISLMLWLSNGSSSSITRYQSDQSISYRKETGQRRWWSFV